MLEFVNNVTYFRIENKGSRGPLALFTFKAFQASGREN